MMLHGTQALQWVVLPVVFCRADRSSSSRFMFCYMQLQGEAWDVPQPSRKLKYYELLSKKQANGTGLCMKNPLP